MQIKTCAIRNLLIFQILIITIITIITNTMMMIIIIASIQVANLI